MPFCGETLKYTSLCRENVFFAQRTEKNEKIAQRADPALYPALVWRVVKIFLVYWVAQYGRPLGLGIPHWVSVSLLIGLVSGSSCSQLVASPAICVKESDISEFFGYVDLVTT